MKKHQSTFFVFFAFILAQIAWLGLLGLWIYWYVSNYIIYKQVGKANTVPPGILPDNSKVGIFVIGIIMIVGIATAVFVIFRNLTVQRKLTGLYDNFIANITHELKSPLSSIQLYLETLSSKNIPPDKQKEFYSSMAKDTDRLHKLINSILEISRIEQKRVAHNYHISSADIIPKIIEYSFKNFRLPENATKIEGSVRGKCVIDKDAMQIVFDNLTDNAIKYSTSPISISVNLKSDQKQNIIEFTDKGIGIGIKDQKTIFNKFHRVYNRNIPNVKGTGLGLFWVKEIIKLHGGKISVKSEGLGNGTTFVIELPIYKTSKIMYIKSLLRETAKKERFMEAADGE
jgi:two-component system, OmpR family, phosphate regulon sensor histidine kinase PhoR